MSAIKLAGSHSGGQLPKRLSKGRLRDRDRRGADGRRRGDRIIALIEGGKLIQVLEHPDKERYRDQLLYEVDVDGYVHVVPVVREGRTLFLKTIYPSRKATRKRMKGEPE